MRFVVAGDLAPVIAATTQWLVRAYPGVGGSFSATLVKVQARQAVTVAAWLRYPTALDAAFLDMMGPGGAARLDGVVGGDEPESGEDTWRSWVDEVVVSWAACLLADPALAATAVEALADTDHAGDLERDFRRLTEPDRRDLEAAVLLRHPDLLAPIADLHRAELLACLNSDSADAA
ncbi:hypothetical protein GCM10012275_16060 [Longimycelium tulufanense]|uniref:Uncharacterized protein n=1 Tax=Longimycelium tulufanense TaxID=907463 RepID=A0A8J3CAS8_9PSEU|nr:hypothetical protein [Longimycelium tulufanense]GGM45840.1 hypothetical protein GCM10012275_16060 [Longimycelium tulufanense]